MSERERKKSRPRLAGKRLKAILERANAQLRQVLEHLESELVDKGLARSLTDVPEMLISRLILSGSATYVVTRLSNDILRDFSPRQLEIAYLVLLQRLSQKEAAKQLGISPRTLATHLERVYLKCRVVSQDSLLRQLSLMS